MLLPSCSCCRCKPCPYCTDARCYRVTFSGFSQLPNTFADCNDCNHLDNATIILQSVADENPEVSLSVSGGDANAVLSHTLATNDDRSLSISSVTIDDGGTGYLRPQLVASPALHTGITLYPSSVVCKQPEATFTISGATDPDITLSIDAPHGSGATIPSGITWAATDDPQGNVYEITALGEPSGGDAYLIGDTVYLVNDEQQRSPATARVDDVHRLEPTLENYLVTSSGTFYEGVSASGATLSETQDDDGKTVWTIAGMPSVEYATGEYSPSDTVGFQFGQNIFVVVPPDIVPVVETGRISGWTYTHGGKFRLPDNSAPSFSGSLHTTNGTGASHTTASYPGGGIGVTNFVEGGQTWWRVFGLLTPSTKGKNYSVDDYWEWTFPENAIVDSQPEIHPTLAATGPLIGFTIVDGGQFYLRGGPSELTLLTGGEYYSPGSISTITITDGGTFWPAVGRVFEGLGPCGYDGGSCGGCPASQLNGSVGTRSGLGAQFQFGFDQHSLAVWSSSSGQPIVAATAPARDDQGEPTSCNSVTFQSENIDGACYATGTITVEETSCDDESIGPCPMPEQIALRVTWPAYAWQVWEQNPVFAGFGCGNAYPASNSDAYDETFILDRITSVEVQNGIQLSVPCSTLYDDGEGHGVHFTPYGNVITATISPPDAPPAWYPDPPERRTATAEVVGISGDQVSAITVTDGGAGYEYEIMERVEPTITLTADEGDGGSGATLTANLEQIGSGGDAVWAISSVTIGSGGSGYPATGPVNVTVAEGDVEVTGAGLTFTSTDGVITAVVKSGIQARRPPTVTVDGTSGSGAVLTANIQKYSVWQNAAYYGGSWVIDSVTVVSGGSGYVDGEPAVFAFNEPETTVVSGCAPEGRVETVQEEPEITGVVWWEEGYPGLGVPAVTGTGASFDTSSLLMEPTQSASDYEVVGFYYSCSENRPRWGVAGNFETDLSGIIVSGGAGYQVGNALKLTFSGTGVPAYPSNYNVNFPYLYVSSVDGNGAVTGIKIASKGRIAKDTGVIRRVATSQGNCYLLPLYMPATRCPTGLFYIEDETVGIGAYYAVNGTGTFHTSTPTVTINAVIGSGAQATATLSSGEVSDVNVTNGGSGYSSQQTVWLASVGVGNPTQPGDVYMCDGAIGVLQSGACASAISNRLSAACPGDLIGKTYDLGIVYSGGFQHRRTFDELIGGPGVGTEDVDFGCAYTLTLYGIKYPKRWWLTGGTAEITAVDP